MEAMSSGLPILVSNYSGVTAFITDSNAFPIRVSALNRRTLRAEPDAAHLRRLMRHVVERPAEAAEVGARARRDITDRFSAQVVADAALRLLREAAGVGETEQLGGGGGGGGGGEAGAADAEDRGRKL
jgi:glycosyltransferase involved in cell wall biosynthesis